MKEITFYVDEDLFTKDVNDFIDEIKVCIQLYAEKNHDYGNSFNKGMDLLGDVYGVSRIYDKCNRIINLITNDNVVKEETLNDTLRDLACYSIMMLVYNNYPKCY